MIDSIKQNLKQINLIEPTKYKKAGVLILLVKEDDSDEMNILFTKRSSELSTHSGEVSFPGGMWEEKDSSLLDTALRESNEEISLKINNVQNLGRMNYLLSRHKVEVNPYVGFLERDQDFMGNFEIEEIFMVPVKFLIEPNNIIYKEFKRNDLRISMPSWVYNGMRIWGLTAMIAADFLNICFKANIDTNLELIRGYDQY
ncbi:MAG: coenzyme A pyrophosphatase [Gammaproteobacteria bacterium]|nr:coenzyme A pyrophosphatase [Gammaproteobacteria bacterium]